ncbi:hypothetical protein MPH_03853 [Macrophomina phaseolina MS6]|uniref:AA1-like domain-containing protein n=2 Tax=Macrophomina phaseolina TaxID=35725 RepID=K2S1H7_MACPH|nr:hypothetical protein MPH_03853 [Macrophomina phaseolina MS6]
MQFKQLLPLAATASLALADVRPTTTAGQPTKPLTGDASAVTCGDGSVKHLEYFHTYGLQESHLALTNNTLFTLVEPYTNFRWLCEGISAADGKEFGCNIQNATVPAPAAGFWYTDDLTVLNVIVRWDAG